MPKSKPTGAQQVAQAASACQKRVSGHAPTSSAVRAALTHEASIELPQGSGEKVLPGSQLWRPELVVVGSEQWIRYSIHPMCSSVPDPPPILTNRKKLQHDASGLPRKYLVIYPARSWDRAMTMCRRQLWHRVKLSRRWPLADVTPSALPSAITSEWTTPYKYYAPEHQDQRHHGTPIDYCAGGQSKPWNVDSPRRKGS